MAEIEIGIVSGSLPALWWQGSISPNSSTWVTASRFAATPLTPHFPYG